VIAAPGIGWLPPKGSSTAWDFTAESRMSPTRYWPVTAISPPLMPMTASTPPSPSPGSTVPGAPVPVFDVAVSSLRPYWPSGRPAGMSLTSRTATLASAASSGSLLPATYGASAGDRSPLESLSK
jgi:hypothetical protein